MQVRMASRSLGEDFRYAWLAGLLMAGATLLIAWLEDLPIRDPDSLIPGYIRFPAIVLGAISLDIVPRALWRARRAPLSLWTVLREITRERWPASHWRFAVGGVMAWYLCYATFRNLKSFVPFVHAEGGAPFTATDNVYDTTMARLDKLLWLGNDPAQALHDILGTGFAAHLFSAVYIIWIVLVPVSIAIALVWTRHTAAGSWYVTAVAFDWALGAVIYLLFPSVGPIYSDPKTFAGLPETYVSQLQASMWDDRLAVVGDVVGSGTLQTIAAFASLHVGIMVTICLIVEYVGLARWLRVGSWVFLVLTVFSTVYLGWHFFIDAIAGAALGASTVWLAAMATGNRVGLRPRLRREEPGDASLVAAPAPRVSQDQDPDPAPR
ncbi:phosphatase PAP2 family protein [Nocardioides sp. cx-169]|uniref:phosphatase PAP2 family protein n=1 Tax=Nocardioides sp. cx-169 TaxID=2899080 RepID=UPI001E533077|nr:phosphatase PAP2 family protein [Nocardioides sp. cx-169]MCD4534124.1 phosphatase PAP2 family protein [Nocardioides sp. cx-169]